MPFVGFQLIKHGAAANQLLVLIRPLGGAAGGEPVVEGVPFCLSGGYGSGMLQADALQVVTGVLNGLLQRANGITGLAGQGRIHEVFNLHSLLDLGQITHQRTAKTCQEPGKHHRYQPEAAVKPLFRQAQRLAHGSILIIMPGEYAA